ncbi:MAG: zinc ABC transporter substrate-binding protein [Planctomyces sp.]|nr:zinc ABC transporter substrate-binding protein [Planctomyces sp.]
MRLSRQLPGLFILSCALLSAFMSGCSDASREDVAGVQASSGGSAGIAVTSLVLEDLTRSIVADSVEVVNVVPASKPSRLWKPTSKDVKQLQGAQRILIQGAGYEPWRDRITVPQSRLIDTSSGYYDQLIRIPDAVTHQHGPDGRHSHPGTVWATWLDPELLGSQLQRITTACSELVPDHRDDYEQRTARLSAEIENLERQIASITSLSEQISGEGVELEVLSDTSAPLYLARRIGWKLSWLHWPEPGELLSDSDREELKEILNERAKKSEANGAPALFLLRSDRSPDDAVFAESLGLKVVRIDLCEKMSDTAAPVIKRLEKNLQEIEKALVSSEPKIR